MGQWAKNTLKFPGQATSCEVVYAQWEMYEDFKKHS